MKTSPTTRREAFTTAGLAVLGASLAPSTLAADAADGTPGLPYGIAAKPY